MELTYTNRLNFAAVLMAILALFLGGCAGEETLPPATLGAGAPSPDYRIGPGDSLKIFVWRQEDLSVTVPVRPDGKISVPLIEDLPAAHMTPTELARSIEEELSRYVQEPLVTVIVTGFLGPFEQQVRVVGEAAEPQAIPYRANMTLLDVMIAVGGLTDFAAGNKARIVRLVNGEQKAFNVRADDLLRDGDITANVEMRPGDVLIIPESFF
jgi:polysaccharide export outer membrane protein